MSRRRALIEFAYAAAEDEQWSTLAVTSQEMLAVERQVKGFTANTFFTNVSVSGLYRIAHVVLRVRGLVERTMTFDDFVEGYDVKLGPDNGDPQIERDEDEDEPGSEADPTQPTA